VTRRNTLLFNTSITVSMIVTEHCQKYKQVNLATAFTTQIKHNQMRVTSWKGAAAANL